MQVNDFSPRRSSFQSFCHSLLAGVALLPVAWTMPLHRGRAAFTSRGSYLGPICSASFSSMRYSDRRAAAGSLLILTTLPLK